MSAKRTWFSTVLGLALVGIATLTLAPYRLVAQARDGENVARLKEENAKLKQELDATRAEIEALREARLAAKQLDDAWKEQQRVGEAAEKHEDAARQLQLAARELETLAQRFTQNHPDVLAKQLEIQKLQEQLSESARHLALTGRRGGSRGQFVPANPEQIARSREHRELLAREIELAEQQVRAVRQKIEVGKEGSEALLRVQRDLLDLKLRQAELNGSKAERRAVLLQQLQVAEQLLKEQKKRVELGIVGVDDAIAFEREVVRLKRELAAFP